MKKFVFYFNLAYSLFTFVFALGRSELSYYLLVFCAPVYLISYFIHFMWAIIDLTKYKNFKMLYGFIFVALIYASTIAVLPRGFGRM